MWHWIKKREIHGVFGEKRDTLGCPYWEKQKKIDIHWNWKFPGEIKNFCVINQQYNVYSDFCIWLTFINSTRVNINEFSWVYNLPKGEGGRPTKQKNLQEWMWRAKEGIFFR